MISYGLEGERFYSRCLLESARRRGVQICFVVRNAVRPDYEEAMKPKLSMETATQLAIFLSNRPGALARVCDALANAEINIHAMATSDTIDHSVVRMVVSDPTKALMLLGESGALALESDVLMIESDNEPGTLAKIADSLSKAAVNIEYAYLATSPKSNKGLMILKPSDVAKAQASLTELV